MNEIIRSRETLYEEIKLFTGCKPKGSDKLQEKLDKFVSGSDMELFVPWAAPANGRIALTGADRETIDWLFDDSGLVKRMKKFGKTTCLVMFADTYAKRNGFDMNVANRYWQNISGYASQYESVAFTATSMMEDGRMSDARARNAYAFEKLLPPQREKIITAAAKYSGESSDIAIYESAAEYSMLRAAEADYVTDTLDALWVSLNWPERDIMCGDVPRVYIPETLRAPWLKEN